MMYILYLNHGEELKAKALPLIWCFVYRLMPMVVMLVRHNIFLRYHVNMQFNKIPQLVMHCNEIYGGMIKQGIGRGIIQTDAR